MSLSPPNLDDRDWGSLVEEAKQRIASKCPEWTDFNPSDPGMTLVELMAWMTETVLYRLNRVPDLNYIKYMELMGVRLQPARPAKTWVFFQVQDKAPEKTLQTVPRGTTVSTRPQSGREPVTFVTCDKLELTTSAIVRTCSRFGSPEKDMILNLEGENPWEADLFDLSEADTARAQLAAHNLYLGDPGLSRFGTQTVLDIQVEMAPNQSNESLTIEWQAWTGESWKRLEIEPEKDGTSGFQKSGAIRFDTLPLIKKSPFEKLELQQIGALASTSEFKNEVFWLRAHLTGSHAQVLPVLAGVQFRISSNGCVTMPHKALVRTPPHDIPGREADKIPYAPVEFPPHPLEIGGDFQIFGTEVVKDSTFFLSSELFQHGGAEIEIEFRFRVPLDPNVCEEFEIHWEYQPKGAGWEAFGKSTTRGALESPRGFSDDTNAFSKDGKIKFTCPSDLTQTEVGGQSGWFIRARVDKAKFKPGSKVEIRANSVLLGYTGTLQPWTYCISENYAEIHAHPSGSSFEPYFINRQQNPAFYICLRLRPALERGPYRLFLDVVPQDGNDPNGNVFWEYAKSEREWAALDIKQDGTEGFAHSGLVQFVSKPDWVEARHFDAAGYWLRVRWEATRFLSSPRLRRVLLNGIEVEQTLGLERILGSSDGSPDQSFSLNFNILENPELWVRETDDWPPNVREALKLGKEFVEDQDYVKDKNAGWWIKWKEVQNFHQSRIRLQPVRHFTVDLETGEFTFGNGKSGSIPHALQENIKAVYRVTQGEKGNVGKEAIIVLERSHPHVKSVKNYHAAEGGANQEDVEKAKMRAPWELKHRGRAVTQDDFIELAQKASQLVGKADCYDDDGLVRVVIVPNIPGAAPMPDRGLLETVVSYLGERKLINTRLKVEGPKYKQIYATVGVALKISFGGDFGTVEQSIRKALNDFVHPLTGSDNRSGWERGRALHESELYYLIESLPEVDWVDVLELRESESDPPVNRINLDPDYSFPSFSKIEIKRVFG